MVCIALLYEHTETHVLSLQDIYCNSFVFTSPTVFYCCCFMGKKKQNISEK